MKKARNVALQERAPEALPVWPAIVQAVTPAAVHRPTTRRSRRLAEEAPPPRIDRPAMCLLAGLEVDVQAPWNEPENGRATPLVCDCSHLYVSSQRQVFSRRSMYHLHCPACGRAGALSGELWAEVRKQYDKARREQEPDLTEALPPSA